MGRTCIEVKIDNNIEQAMACAEQILTERGYKLKPYKKTETVWKKRDWLMTGEPYYIKLEGDEKKLLIFGWISGWKSERELKGIGGLYRKHLARKTIEQIQLAVENIDGKEPNNE